MANGAGKHHDVKKDLFRWAADIHKEVGYPRPLYGQLFVACTCMVTRLQGMPHSLLCVGVAALQAAL
jgi:hypothetical protein